jgi:hypothetical protein
MSIWDCLFKYSNPAGTISSAKTTLFADPWNCLYVSRWPEQVTERLLKEKLSAKKSMLTDDHRQPGHCLKV